MHRLTRSGLLMAWLLVLPLSPGCAAPVAVATAPSYDVRYSAKLMPDEGSAVVTIEIIQSDHVFHAANFRFDAERMELIAADGTTELTDGRLQWRPPDRGGELTLRVKIDHRRNGDSFDARITDEWALMRGDDLFPAARSITTVGATSRASLRIEAPSDWSVVTPYGRGRGKWLAFENPQRRFDRPTGWIVAGRLGVRMDDIAGSSVVVAAPRNQQMRRNDILALLRWTLPEIVSVFGTLPATLTIVGAADPMWRGGLSAPTSLYLHSSRPLISENGTSTLLHEVMHLAIDSRGDDWLVEGLAEYYALEALFRSGTISRKRYEAAQQQQKTWAKQADKLPRRNSRGAQTALAVTVLMELNALLLNASDQERDLDDVVKQLDGTELTLATLMAATRVLTNEPVILLEQRIQALVD